MGKGRRVSAALRMKRAGGHVSIIQKSAYLYNTHSIPTNSILICYIFSKFSIIIIIIIHIVDKIWLKLL